MNPRLAALLKQKQAYIDRARTLETKAEWDDDDKKFSSEASALMVACDQEIEEAKGLSEMAKKADIALNGNGIKPAAANAIVRDAMLENAAKHYRGTIRNFTGTREERTTKAFQFGMWLLAISGNDQARDYCAMQGLSLTQDRSKVQGGRDFSAALGQSEGINADGGYLVAPEFEDDFIVLREKYGVIRQHARIVPMSSDTKTRNRKRGGLTATFVGESGSPATTKQGWDQVKLVAKKIMTLSYMTTELNEDAIINMGDDLAGDIAWAFAELEDDCGFNGDSTSPYGGIVGVRQRLLDTYTASGGYGLTVGSGSVGSNTDYSNLTLADFNKVTGTLPQFADQGEDTGWFCHKRFYHGVMERLMLAAGGVTAAEVAQGRRTLIFCGYPVFISQVMPTQEAVSQICCLFGNLRLAADFGDRRQTTIMISEHAAFTTDELAIRGTERFDINVHDVGDHPLKTGDAGPIVGLITPAS